MPGGVDGWAVRLSHLDQTMLIQDAAVLGFEPVAAGSLTYAPECNVSLQHCATLLKPIGPLIAGALCHTITQYDLRTACGSLCYLQSCQTNCSKACNSCL